MGNQKSGYNNLPKKASNVDLGAWNNEFNINKHIVVFQTPLPLDIDLFNILKILPYIILPIRTPIYP